MTQIIFNQQQRFLKVFLSISFAAIFVFCSTTIKAEARPNVLFILADDLGWSDTTLYGTTTLYKTPNIERLSQRGMTFNRAYSSSPLCSPTRASVLTGLSPARIGITTPSCHLPTVSLNATIGTFGPPNRKEVLPKSATRFDTKYYTLAEMFKDNGYATGHFGKWHLGKTPYSPLEHGFDIDVPHWPGPGPAGSYVAPWKFPDFDPDTPDQHIEDRMAQEAVTFLEKHKDEPFFLNYWMFSVHAPFDAKQDLIDQYKKVVDPNNPQRSPTYAAMIESMDDAVGTLLDTLDRLNLSEKTIIVFASDNGGNMYNEVDGTTPTSNAPLRGGKASMYEGGVRGPAIVVYPNKVEAGSRSDTIIQSSDFYPTLLELLDIDPQPGQSFDGMSIAPALQGQPLERDGIFTFFPHSAGVPDWLPASVSLHQDNWKLIRIFHNGENGNHRWKLFNLKSDIGEKEDLVDKFPERVGQMDQLIEQFLIDTQAVVPIPNPKFDPSQYDPDLEGFQTVKKGKPAPQKKPTANLRPVAGWKPAGTCTAAVKNNSLVISSTGRDPHVSYQFAEPIKQQPVVLEFSLQSDSRGEAKVYWHEQGVAPLFHLDRSTPIVINHDGKEHTYQVKLTPKNPLQAIRIDPASGPGKITLTNIKLTTADGKTLHQWKFK